MFLKFSLEAFKERNRVCRRSRKSRHHFVVVQPPRFPRRMLHHVVAHRHLTIRDQHHLIFFPHAQDRRPMHLRSSSPMSHPTSIPPLPSPVIETKFRFVSFIYSTRGLHRTNCTNLESLIRRNLAERQYFVGRRLLRYLQPATAEVDSVAAWISSRLAERSGTKRGWRIASHRVCDEHGSVNFM